MGLPVISTNWSGITAYLDESVGYPIKVEGLVRGCLYLPPLCWPTCAADALVHGGWMDGCVTAAAQAEAHFVQPALARSVSSASLLLGLHAGRGRAWVLLPASRATAAGAPPAPRLDADSADAITAAAAL
jgi:hypothetical protein